MKKNVSVVIEKNTEEQYARLMKSLNGMFLPNNMVCSIIVIDDSSNLYSSYNEFQSKNSDEYRVYISSKVEEISQNIIMKLLICLMENDDCAMVGVHGAVLPLDGDIYKASSIYGQYLCCNDASGTVNGKKNLFDQEVEVLDSGIFATSIDISWDTDMGIFAVAAQCLKAKKLKKKTMVVMCDTPAVSYYTSSDFDTASISTDYSLQLQRFYERYVYDLNPLVSVYIPTYNAPHYLKQALDSVLNQDYPNIEILIGDDSTDSRTREMMKEYASFPQIQYFFHSGPLGENGYYNSQFLLNKSKGQYINCLLHDDLLHPKKISAMMTVLKADINNEIGAVASTRTYINSKGKKIGLAGPWHPVDDTLLTGNEVIYKVLFNSVNFIGETTTVLQRRDTYCSFDGDIILGGYYYEMRDRYMGDISMWLDILRHKNIMFLSESLSSFRIHDAQNTNNLNMVCGCVINWLNFIVITWLHKEFITSEKQLHSCMINWSNQHEYNIHRCLNADVDEDMKRCLKNLYNYVANKEYEKVIDLSIRFIMEKCDGEDIKYMCKRNKMGLWERR